MKSINELLEAMAHLRDPAVGCPWDREQTFFSIKPHTLEEAYEVADAIERRDMQDLREELSDLLLQIVFYAQIAQELGVFNFEDVVRGCSEKLKRRHPLVFGGERAPEVGSQSEIWEAQKAQERIQKAGGTPTGALSGIAQALPALTRAVKLQKRAARVGFDWDTIDEVWEKLEEELSELKAAFAVKVERDKVEEELGDLLFCCVNLARHLTLDPEQALRHTNAKFERRFGFIEARIRESGRELKQVGLKELDAYWEAAKRDEQRRL
ncbi:MAG: nucleoside triphosphate pyrophosphohydrolase [Gammaproteobacteria bacterium]